MSTKYNLMQLQKPHGKGGQSRTHQGQNLKGQILRHVLLQRVDAGIVYLPVHDALARHKRRADWAIEAMTNARAAIAYGTHSNVKVDQAEVASRLFAMCCRAVEVRCRWDTLDV